jgi:hypothetical protein
MQDRKPIAVNNQRRKGVFQNNSRQVRTRIRELSIFPARDLAQEKNYNRGRPYEDGGSANSVPDTSSHRWGLLLPSDMNGPPFF